MAEELVKMSPKGQLVVPKKIRARENLRPTDRFVAVEVDKGVLFKKVNIPDTKVEFKELVKDISKHFEDKKIKKKDINEAVKWARKKQE